MSRKINLLVHTALASTPMAEAGAVVVAAPNVRVTLGEAVHLRGWLQHKMVKACTGESGGTMTPDLIKVTCQTCRAMRGV
jgi:hypothetical protein